MTSERVLQPRGRTSERLLLYGPQGSGKSKAVADMLNAGLGPGQTAYIVDTDNSWARFLESGNYPGLVARAEWMGGDEANGGWDDEFCEESGRVVLMHCSDWEEEKYALGYAWEAAGRGDWVIVDSITHPWDHIASWYIERVHGSELPEFLISARMKQVAAGDSKKADGGASQMLVEWSFINKEWSKVFLTPFVNARCHVAITAEAKTLRTDDRGDSKDIKDLYGVVGFKPDSQRRVGANAQTVLFMELGRMGRDTKWFVSTVKDRERDRLSRVEWDDMAQTYLFKIAGWRPKNMQTNEGDE